MHTSAYVYMYKQSCLSMWGHRTTLRGQFSPSTTWYSGIKLRSWALMARALFHRATSSLFHFIKVKFQSWIISPLVPLCLQYLGITIPCSTFTLWLNISDKCIVFLIYVVKYFTKPFLFQTDISSHVCSTLPFLLADGNHLVAFTF